ncbi:LysR family transcriptional regulator [Halocynthiibacter styelae]|uniref:LysR family transcriptional regulator n=1 Tax=Halocynthiibacter styelae TaxID=2761955 RepID=A0A8J7IDK5_9RHOB|nr:LysR family transcriptional regulator [Paenihalocynthiibacter styelae]MBI1494533.1 LysR family transcriptional regulator [Paenihalocynthiibacter styelae]
MYRSNMEIIVKIKSLHTFTTVARIGTIGGASKELNCVQSNVTTRIKALEAEVGVSLFNRSRTGMTLTSAGVAFLPYAQEVIHAEERARASIESFESSVRMLRIGSMESTLAVRLPGILSSLRAKKPNLRLHIHSGPTEELIVKLLQDQIDIALIGGKFTHPELRGYPLFAEEMVMISATEFETPEDLKSLPVIVFKQGCSYRDYSRRWMRKSGLAPNEIFELGTLDGILGCVASGVGVSCLPRSVVDGSQLRNLLRIHTLDDPERFIDTYAMLNPKSVRNGAVEAFLHDARTTLLSN